MFKRKDWDLGGVIFVGVIVCAIVLCCFLTYSVFLSPEAHYCNSLNNNTLTCYINMEENACRCNVYEEECFDGYCGRILIEEEFFIDYWSE